MLRAVCVLLVMVAAATACSRETAGRGSLPAAPSPPAGSRTAATTVVPPSSLAPSVAPSRPLRTTTVTNTVTGRTYSVSVWAERKDGTCADHAYGAPVVGFLRAHPCRGLTRLLATTTVDGRRVGFAQSALGFLPEGSDPESAYRVASQFRQLVTADGTGNIADLLREGARLPAGPASVPSPDAFSALGQDSGVVVLDAWYLDGPTPANDPPLVAMAQDLFLQSF